jgi:hypothetical protein
MRSSCGLNTTEFVARLERSGELARKGGGSGEVFRLATDGEAKRPQHPVVNRVYGDAISRFTVRAVPLSGVIRWLTV